MIRIVLEWPEIVAFFVGLALWSVVRWMTRR